ncbi:MAG: transporter substrate-binding domain-containing protein [Rhodocyclaceae bacterium]|nr:transporter substrate-binding domain-containing protein [Rhodocyclaceae bacterium]
MWTMKTSKTFGALMLAPALMLAGGKPSVASDLSADLKQPGKLVVAVYKQFPPFSQDGRGIDVELGRALAERLGLTPDLMAVNAREDMADDLKNSVWQGHYLNGRTADVMMHVPVDPVLIEENPQVHIFGPYQQEAIGIARDQRHIPQIHGPAGLTAFTQEKIGVEGDTIADVYLMGAFGGRLREHVVHFRTVGAATEALKKGEVSAVMAPVSELEAGLPGHGDHIVISPYSDRMIAVNSWNLGMAVKSDKPELQAALDRALASLAADGTVARIFAKYGIGHHRPN